MRGFVVDGGAHEAGIKTINTALTFFLSGNNSSDVWWKGESTSYRLGPSGCSGDRRASIRKNTKGKSSTAGAVPAPSPSPSCLFLFLVKKECGIPAAGTRAPAFARAAWP